MSGLSFNQWKLERMANPETERSRRYYESFLDGFKFGIYELENAPPERVVKSLAFHLICLRAFYQCRLPSENDALLGDERLRVIASAGGQGLARLLLFALDHLVVYKDGRIALDLDGQSDLEILQ